MDTYLLPSGSVLNHEIEVKRSRFLTHVERVDSEEEARAVISSIRSSMPDARHHCTAFIVPNGDNLPISRSSDDGEPSGTAGRPMLDVLTSIPLMGVVCVVTRYFGGTLLGTGGLVRAYSDAVREALEGAHVARRDVLPLYTALLPHADAGRYHAELNAAGFAPDVSYDSEGARLRIATSNSTLLRDTFARLTQGQYELCEDGTRISDVVCARIVSGKAVALAQ